MKYILINFIKNTNDSIEDIATESFLLGNVGIVTIFLIYMEKVLQIVYNDVDEGDGSVPTNIKSTIYLYIKNNF